MLLFAENAAACARALKLESAPASKTKAPVLQDQKGKFSCVRGEISCSKSKVKYLTVHSKSINAGNRPAVKKLFD